MTVLNVVNQLIIHFCEKDVFTLEDFDNLSIDSSLEGHRHTLILTALDDMESRNLLRQVGSGVWMLTEPIRALGQDVGISIQTSILIGDTIESYMKANDLPFDKVDPFNIHEGHILRILEIVNDILNKDLP